jgi:hypothetical protein
VSSIGFAAHFLPWQCKTNVGAGLLAKAECQSVFMSLTHRLREQARSHRGSAVGSGIAVSQGALHAGDAFFEQRARAAEVQAYELLVLITEVETGRV